MVGAQRVLFPTYNQKKKKKFNFVLGYLSCKYLFSSADSQYTYNLQSIYIYIYIYIYIHIYIYIYIYIARC